MLGIRLAVVVLLAGLAAPVSAAVTTDLPAEERLRLRVETLHLADGGRAAGELLAASGLITELYARNGFQPMWRRPTMVEELMTSVAGAETHGLDPEDYHHRAIERLWTAGVRPGDGTLAGEDLDLLLTDAFARLAFTLHFGKLLPNDFHPQWNFERSFGVADPVAWVARQLDAGTVAAGLIAAAPQTLFYRRLQDLLARYRTIETSGGWPTIEAGPTLELGSTGPRVAALRQRLEISGDLPPDPAVDPELFDEAADAAVRRFQTRHSLEADGKVGRRTLAELDVPVRHRIDQVRANLERIRWVLRDVGDNVLIVNIAGFDLWLVRNREVAWRTRVQVGTPYHQTPVFTDLMRYVVLNPTWTVPPGILRNEVLPAARKDPGYLPAERLRILDRQGREIDPSTLDLSGPFPYTVRQDAGPDNSLGVVKLMFPNPYHVYLHDTPSKSKFARAERAFSHGCIRVQDPLTLTELVLEGSGWDRARIDAVIASGETTTVRLPTPLPVMLLYWTVEVEADGTAYFFRDPYDRDDAVIAGLDRPFAVAPGMVPAMVSGAAR
ncbi:MAG TPA: L,D-transpeptidase family protein [Methylomirabilota bacterium]|nr:L,D-transpeptidase family protein [Methylomirabilota bacterium]